MASKGKIISKDETEMVVAVAYVKKDSAYHSNYWEIPQKSLFVSTDRRPDTPTKDTKSTRLWTLKLGKK